MICEDADTKRVTATNITGNPIQLNGKSSLLADLDCLFMTHNYLKECKQSAHWDVSGFNIYGRTMDRMELNLLDFC